MMSNEKLEMLDTIQKLEEELDKANGLLDELEEKMNRGFDKYGIISGLDIQTILAKRKAVGS